VAGHQPDNPREKRREAPSGGASVGAVSREQSRRRGTPWEDTASSVREFSAAYTRPFPGRSERSDPSWKSESFSSIGGKHPPSLAKNLPLGEGVILPQVDPSLRQMRPSHPRGEARKYADLDTSTCKLANANGWLRLTGPLSLKTCGLPVRTCGFWHVETCGRGEKSPPRGNFADGTQ
jgi:hypothetical protein